MAIAAILLASVVIFLTHLELNGTKELERVIAEAPPTSADEPARAPSQGMSQEETRDAAVVTSRWVIAFAQ
jgi:hypothetical protein